MSDKGGLTRRQGLALGAGGLIGLGAGLGSAPSLAQSAAEVTFWTVRINTPELAGALKGVLSDFEAQNKGIKIKHEPVSGNLVYPKFLTAIRGQQMPDIAEAFSYHPLQFAAVDQMEPMDDIIEEWQKNGLLSDIFNEFAYKKFFWKGHYWGVPYNLDIRAIYYRRDLLDAKGIKPPTTWDEFQAAAIALNDPRNGIAGAVFPAGDFHIAQHYFMAFMFQAGGSILDKDGNLVFGTTARDANIKALTFLTDLATKHKVTPPGIASYNTDEANTVFLQGRAAFGFGTGAVIGRIMRENPALFDKVGILEVLEGPAGKAGKLTAGFYNPMFIWKHSPQKEQAKQFVRWFVQPGRLDPVYKALPGQHWPIFKKEVASERVRSNRLLEEALTKVVPYATDFAYPGYGRPEMGVIDGEKMFAGPVNQVVVGAKTPAKAIDDAHAEMAKLFKA